MKSTFFQNRLLHKLPDVKLQVRMTIGKEKDSGNGESKKFRQTEKSLKKLMASRLTNGMLACIQKWCLCREKAFSV